MVIRKKSSSVCFKTKWRTETGYLASPDLSSRDRLLKPAFPIQTWWFIATQGYSVFWNQQKCLYQDVVDPTQSARGTAQDSPIRSKKSGDHFLHQTWQIPSLWDEPEMQAGKACRKDSITADCLILETSILGSHLSYTETLARSVRDPTTLRSLLPQIPLPVRLYILILYPQHSEDICEEISVRLLGNLLLPNWGTSDGHNWGGASGNSRDVQ